MITHPSLITRPLRLFDKEQIEALREEQEKIRKQEELSQKLKDGLLKIFIGRVKLTATIDVGIYASDAAEADKIIRNMEHDPNDWEIDNVITYEVKS